MNQPKFKFGDKVKSFDGEVFIINKIEQTSPDLVKEDGYFFYYGTNGDSQWENYLEPYQEPQKKKLYAYRGDTGMVVFYDKDDLIGRRLPVFDIEYPEAK